MVSTFAPPTGVGIPSILIPTDVLSAGKVTVSDIAVKSTPLTAVPPKNICSTAGGGLACAAAIFRVAGEHPLTIVCGIPSIVEPIESRRLKEYVFVVKL